MWSIRNVKVKGKKAFTLNFWKCVLVALILSIVIGASSGGFNGGSLPALTDRFDSSDVVDSDDLVEDISDEFDIDVGTGDFHFTYDFDEDGAKIASAMVVLFILCIVVWIIATLIGLAIKILLLNPFEYGCRKFFRKNLDEPAKLSNIFYVFSSNYKNVVKTAFLRNLFIGLWSLLFIIPGIIKSYEYRLVPYIISENPAMNYKDALAESKKLMMGNKWKSFVLDLSFIGWDILSALTLGVLDIFFVGPYKASTDAALYETLKYGIEAK